MYVLLPFNFKRMASNEVLIVNECGDYCTLDTTLFNFLISKSFTEIPDNIIHQLESRHFISTSENLDIALSLSANKYRSRHSYLHWSTSLHMMVVTLKCNHKCQYCQVSSEEKDAYRFDMSAEVARKVVDTIFEGASNDIKIEFQGGDALLNWEAVQVAVLHAEHLNETHQKKVEFVACTNLFALSETHLQFAKEHNIHLSTSLDGPKALHDKYRVLRGEGSSYDTFVRNLFWARDVLGKDKVSALMTTSEDALTQITNIVDEYIQLEFDGIFFRALNPYGDAYKQELYYTPEKFVQMFIEGLEYIVDKNLKGLFFPEFYTALLMRRILAPFSTGFVDLQSPSGAGISGVIYDYNGDVYPADEARMIARMGNSTFKMGNVFENTFQEIFSSDVLKKIISSSCVETMPGCSGCVYRTYCGVDVFRNYLETGNISTARRNSFFCRKQTLLFDYLFSRIKDEQFMSVVMSWMRR